jgi:hypothetical protein
LSSAAVVDPGRIITTPSNQVHPPSPILLIFRYRLIVVFDQTPTEPSFD